MPRKGPVAAKDLKVYSVDEYPYLVQKKYGETRYFRSFRAAQTFLLEDMDRLKTQLPYADARRALADLESRIGAIPETGGGLLGVVDPYTGTRYDALLVKRDPLEH